MQETYELLHGPQDGAKITGRSIPKDVYLGPKWLGDGFAAWGVECCPRFPVRYQRENGRFVFVGFEYGR